MNSIIWKGVASTTIQGLLICELPPITKPEMRTKETVIDGRDGSIVEELGYASYVKTVTIGLHGNFDIDKVIKYFTGEGDIIFSNEPDKVYKAKISGKIDYTRLLRYRQASIPFMVQPFKYKLNEYLRETQTATASGTSIVVNDSARATFSTFRIYGKTMQNGKPTPEAPVHLLSLGVGKTINISINEQTVAFTTALRGIPTTDTSLATYTDASGQMWYADEIDIKKGVHLQRCGIIIYTDEIIKEPYISTTGELTEGAQVVFILDEPIETALTDEQIAIFNNLNLSESITISNDADAFVLVEYIKPFEVFNEGLEDSKPLMILKGSGTVEISVNGVGIFSYTFPEGENEVYIDSEKEDAYLGSVLKNRNMNGEFPVLIPKTNIIEWSGDIESISILPRSRWL